MDGVSPSQIVILGASDYTSARRRANRRSLQSSGIRLLYSVTFKSFNSDGVTTNYERLSSQLQTRINAGTFNEILYSLASGVDSPLMDASSAGITILPPVVISTTSSIDESSSFSGPPFYATIICLALVLPIMFGAAVYYFCRRSMKLNQESRDEFDMIGTQDHHQEESGQQTSPGSGYKIRFVNTPANDDNSNLSPKFDDLYSAYDASHEEIIEMSTKQVKL